ncbi:hydantoinase/oxoprolinase family protein [Desulfobacula sp.]|uniref:hydantoinase/oxoprolinase family protein n=1 Tax=Desulfobacula sp. TaxID=2593537 RepID=UPI003429EB50
MKTNTDDFIQPGYGGYIVDIDIGSTFTDTILSWQNRVEHFKIETTPHDFSICVKNSLNHASKKIALSDISSFLHHTSILRLSTSLSTNIIVERTGTKCGMLLPKGWKTRLKKHLMMRKTLSPAEDDYNLKEIDVTEIKKPFDGQHIDPAVEEKIRQNFLRLVEWGAAAVVVCLGEDTLSVEMEQSIKKLIQKYNREHTIGFVPLHLGHQVSSNINFISRLHSSLLNAYCHQGLSCHLMKIKAYLRKEGYRRPLLIVNSNGGTTRISKTYPVQTINSGASAGIFGVSEIAKKENITNLISIDIGGTSTEIGQLKNGRIERKLPAEFSGFPFDLSFYVNKTLGIGGGSIVTIGEKGEICLGPQSTGAFPGPACYALGGREPTLTDAYLLLGYFDGTYFLGGQKRIHRKVAAEVFNRTLAQPLGIPVEEAAFMVKETAVQSVGKAISKIIASTNWDIPEISLFPLGGGGGCIGADIAKYLRITDVRFFRRAPVSGAFGSSLMDVQHLYHKRINFPFSADTAGINKICSKINSILVLLQRKAVTDMNAEGFEPEEVKFHTELDIKVINSMIVIRIPLYSSFIWGHNWVDLVELAGKEIHKKTSKRNTGHLSVAGLHLIATGRTRHLAWNNLPEQFPSEHSLAKGKRFVYEGKGKKVSSIVYEWHKLSHLHDYEGPCIIESRDTTIIVPSDMCVRIDKKLSGRIFPKSDGLIPPETKRT